MIYVTDKGINVIKEHLGEDFPGEESVSSIKNAIYVKCKNGDYYTYLKSGKWLYLNKAFSSDSRSCHYFYFLQIKEISIDEQEKHKELALNKFNNIDDIEFKGFYFMNEYII